jgi:predicted TIM-barrel fold metal-dependent hydrolase
MSTGRRRLAVLALILVALALAALVAAQPAGELPIVDAHCHDAPIAERRIGLWDKYGVSKVVLFGSISEPAALETDRLAWKAYERRPDLIIPFFAGLDVHDPLCLERARELFERGYFGIGEIVAASTYSPITSKLKWKGLDPMDGYFPALYELCAEYRAPILLHIDPPNGAPVAKLEEALVAYPATVFIFGHANAYTTKYDLEKLMKAHPNLYLDFYAGFTAFDKNSRFRLDDFVPLIEAYPDRIVVSSDSGSGIKVDEAYEAIRILLGKLKPTTASAVASGNILRIIEGEPITGTQRAEARRLAAKGRLEVDVSRMNKREASEFIFSHR